MKSAAQTLLFVLAVSSQPILAGPETADSPADLPSVEVKGSRDAISIPNRRAYDFVKKIADASGASVRLGFRATPTHEAWADPLQLSLEYDETLSTIPVSSTGVFYVPLDDAAATAKDADVVANKKKGDVDLAIFLEPTLGTEHLELRSLRALGSQARSARAEILPWHLRIVLPTIRAVGVCFAEPGASVAIRQGDKTLSSLPADERENDEATGKDLYCAARSAARKTGRTMPGSSRPQAPAQLQFIGSLF